MDGSTIAVVLTTVATLAALIGGFVMRDRIVMKAISQGDAELHSRINDVKDKYVRRDDLGAHIASIERAVEDIKESQRTGLNDLKEEMRRTHTRIDEVLRNVPQTPT